MSVFQYAFFTLFLLSILISIEAGIYLSVRYRTGLAYWAGLVLLSQAFELIGYLARWIPASTSVIQSMYLVQVLFYTLLCIFWLLFVFVFTRHMDWIRPRNLALILALPAVYLLMIAAECLQGLGGISTGVPIVGSLFSYPFTNSLPGLLLIIFAYGTAIFSILILLRFYTNSTPELRLTKIPLLAGPVLLSILSGMELSGIHPIQPFSVHQLSITSISLLAFWAVFDLPFRSALSSARELVIDQMHDAVLVLDQHDQIVELNFAARQIFGHYGKEIKNLELSQIWPEGTALISGKSGTNFSVGETTIQVNGLENTYDINNSQLLDAYHEPAGRVIVLRNVTERDLMEKAIEDRTQELQRTNAFLAGLAEAMVNLQKAADPSRVLDIVGNELYALGLRCFIAQLDPASNELLVSYVYIGKNKLGPIEKVLEDRLIGYRLKRSQFLKLYKLLDGKEIIYRDQLIKGISSFEDQQFSQQIKRIMGLIGLDLDITTIVVRLVAGERALGLMGVWGDDLRESDIAPINMFASQVAWAIEKAAMYEKEIQRSTEVARVNSLVIALSKVASILGTASSQDMMFDTLGSELKRIGLDCGIVSLDPAGEAATIQYLSFDSASIRAVEKLAGVSAKNYLIPRKFWPDDRAIRERAPVWYSNPANMLRSMFPAIPNSAANKSLQLLGFKPETQLCMLPLISKEHVIGAFLIWGLDLHPSDSTILAVFASQMANILQSANDYEYETRRANELARTNSIILALSNVAARLDSTSDLIQVFETLGNELKKIKVNCMVGTIDDTKQAMKLEYLTISSEIKAWAGKLGAFWPAEITIPRSLWPTDKALTEKTPYWDPDMIGSTVNMFPYIPKDIFLRSFELTGMNPNDPVCYLPLINGEDVIGILAVWGPDLRREDIPGLSVFANQVSTAIVNARLYNQAQKEIVTRTQAESHIREALREKEILLKEVHHRVKNNLQVISSLLNLQANQITDQNTRDALRESQNRVRSMALIHEKLYQSSDLAQIDFASYLKGLVNFLAQSYRTNSSKVMIKTKAQNVYLDIDSAIPCGLIINELVSNSLKYAFPENNGGCVEIIFEEPARDEYVLAVRDDGVGLPSGFDPAKSTSLGLKLVTSLVQQLSGTLTMGSTNGVSFEIKFKKVQ